MQTRELAKNPFVRRIDLNRARLHAATARQPRAHQTEALRTLKTWFETTPKPPEGHGGLLVLPTGGGKTFTSVRFLCDWPLSAGYKVLWLAHTHHLLEQAFETFGPEEPAGDQSVEVSNIREPRNTLQIRVVSGMPGHAKIASVSASDDVVIGSLQTFAGAQRNDHEALTAFIDSAKGKLIVVFDEAHHAPAPTYARFVEALRRRVAGLRVLGLTATPVYENKLRHGWLKKLFPQGIVYQTTVHSLMADRVLARPVVIQHATHIKADFDERAFALWNSTFADLPESIIESLAANRDRNDFIVKAYVDNRAKYGKTLIFADRWFQCDYLRQALIKHNVRADVVYSHVDAKGNTPDERNRRTADENTQTIRAFKRGDLDVLINVRMLTEGTDVPNVQSVFLTRQTTSRVLLTQMVGRGLRGPAFGGTEQAFVVSFLDDWKQLINWAEFSLVEGATDDRASESRSRLPVNLVSIALLRQLATQMYQPAEKRPATFLQTLPVGWFRVQFEAQTDASGDIEPVDRLVLVYDVQRKGYDALLDLLAHEDLTELVEPTCTFDSVRERVRGWAESCFAGQDAHLGSELLSDVFQVVRHVAQSLGEKPQFFPFDERSKHDLDALARDVFDRNVGRRDALMLVQAEFDRKDRYWRVLYGSLDNFRDQFELVSRRIENQALRGGQPSTPPAAPTTGGEQYTPSEASDELKRATKERDGWRCLCCGAEDKRHLEVDHIRSIYHGGQHELENLQTLCKRCNRDKGINEQNFRRLDTTIVQSHPDFGVRMEPAWDNLGEPLAWERCIRATFNHYFRCAAVSHVVIGMRGDKARNWVVRLNPGNAPTHLQPHAQGFFELIQARRQEGRRIVPDSIVIEEMNGSSRLEVNRVAT